MTTSKTSTSTKAATSKAATSTKATTIKAQAKKAAISKAKAAPKTTVKEAAALAVTVSPVGAIPSVELPEAVALTGTAFSQSAAAFAEAWQVEQDQQLGLNLLRLVGRTIKGVFVPLLSLGAYGTAKGIERANTEEARAVRAEHWQKFTGLFSVKSEAAELIEAEAVTPEAAEAGVN